MLAADDFSVKSLIRKMNVEIICTTDDPVDSLEHHQKLQDDGFETKVLPAWRPDKAVAVENPKTYGPLAFYDYYYEHKRQQIEAMENAQRVILEVTGEFNGKFNRDYGLFEPYRLEDAEVAVIAVNSTAGTVKAVVDQLRDEGLKVGLLKPRLFRPFPAKELADALRHLKAVAVMDRSVSFGAMDNAGPLFLELVAALAIHGVQAPVADYVYGLGGRDILPSEIERVYRDALKMAETGQAERLVTYLSVRE